MLDPTPSQPSLSETFDGAATSRWMALPATGHSTKDVPMLAVCLQPPCRAWSSAPSLNRARVQSLARKGLQTTQHVPKPSRPTLKSQAKIIKNNGAPIQVEPNP